MPPTSPAEYERATTGVVWRERALRGLLTLRGPDAAEFLQGQLTNDIEALAPGTGCYALLLNHKGKLRADMRVLCPVPDELLVESSRAAVDVVAHMVMTHRVGFDFELTDHGDESALFSLIGPGADDLLARLAGPVTAGAGEHANVRATVAAVPVVAARTDLGVDLLVAGGGQLDPGQIDAVRAELRAAAGEPASAEAVETLRVESGRPLLGRELDGETLPQEADLNERAVSFEKGCYVGQETVARLFYKGKPNRHLRGLTLREPVAIGAPVLAGDKLLGHIGTAVVSPLHGPIALAVLRREAGPGDTVTVGDGVAATVTEPGHMSDEEHNRN